MQEALSRNGIFSPCAEGEIFSTLIPHREMCRTGTYQEARRATQDEGACAENRAMLELLKFGFAVFKVDQVLNTHGKLLSLQHAQRTEEHQLLRPSKNSCWSGKNEVELAIATLSALQPHASFQNDFSEVQDSFTRQTRRTLEKHRLAREELGAIH